jgi:hypothetical protein
MELAELLTVAGVAVVVTILLEVIKRAMGWTPDLTDRFAPLLAVVLGIALGTGFAAYQGADLVLGAITGLLAGASASGLYDNVKAAAAIVR